MRQTWRLFRQLKQPLFVFLICLAAFGLIYRLVADPLGLASSAVVLGLVLFAFYGIYRYVSRQTKPKHHHRSLVSGPFALNKQDHKTTLMSNKGGTMKRKAKRKRENYPFKVIEGKKDKKKRPFSS
ncbi:hypothetical protein J2S00_000518 [Caldalkalibacillus uzonensis]|uniref:Uncharacterized protein n=1 Tax=Caldalkalibacillus uzonensis TaxID=353224 RepID=A0ABU0CMV4_9BACI|nr:SA1362 family protein [Caldalkalibacillus uzonensis]MDQ0337748.1 hypothetical protein [Caldalkalibacillus uzonensis]